MLRVRYYFPLGEYPTWEMGLQTSPCTERGQIRKVKKLRFGHLCTVVFVDAYLENRKGIHPELLLHWAVPIPYKQTFSCPLLSPEVLYFRSYSYDPWTHLPLVWPPLCLWHWVPSVIEWLRLGRTLWRTSCKSSGGENWPVVFKIPLHLRSPASKSNQGLNPRLADDVVPQHA